MAAMACLVRAPPRRCERELDHYSDSTRISGTRARARECGGTRRRSDKQKLRHLANEAYRNRFKKALDTELATEAQQIRERLKNWSRKKLEAEGYALFDLSIRKDGDLFRDQILRFSRPYGDGLLPRHHQFLEGDMVSISQGDPEYADSIDGVVLERAQRFLRVAVKKNILSSVNAKERWRVDKSANAVSHERCTQAVEFFAGGKPAEQDKGEVVAERFVFSEAANAVKELILKQSPEPSVTHTANNLPSRVSGKQTGAFKGSYRSAFRTLRVSLNSSQTQAIEAALCRRVTLWQGPPGTGKTRTLTQFIVVHCATGQGKVLACADSNVAVDNLVEGLLAEGLLVVRLGQPVKVKEQLRRTTIEAQLSAHPLMKKSIKLRTESIRQRQQSKAMKGGTKLSSAQLAEALWQKAKALENTVVEDIFSRAHVVAATCVGAGDPILDGQRFGACVVDEASQATEPASLIPLLRSGADRLVLVGDPAQLPPTVLSTEALEEGLQISLFEHLQDSGLAALLLDTQYRMHPALAHFPSRAFYNGQLLSAPLPSDRIAPNGFDWPDACKPLAFVDCCEGQEVVVQDNSCQNSSEAKLVVSILKKLLSSGDTEGRCGDIGVITPYNAQVRLLKDMLLAEEKDFTGLEIKSVDGFQGREKEVIIISTVRSNLDGILGFVADWRRMNVAITRARRGLIVVGNLSTLQHNTFWKQWLEEIKGQNLLLQVFEPEG